MKNLTIVIFITLQIGFIVTNYQSINAQILTEPLTHSTLSPKKIKISASSFGSYLKDQKLWYFGSSIEAVYLSDRFELGMNLHFNQSQTFTFEPSQHIFRIEEEVIKFDDETRFIANPEEYKLNIPISVYNRSQFWGLNLFSSISFLNQQSRTETATLIKIDSLLLINWDTNKYKNFLLLGNALMGYDFNGVGLNVGISNLPFLRIGDSNFKYEYEPNILPVLMLSYTLDNSKLSSVFDTQSLTFDYQQRFSMDSVFRNKFVETHLFYSRGLDSYLFQIIKASIESPIAEQISIQVGYQNSWSPSGINSFEVFTNWQQSIIFDNHDFLLGNSLPQHKAFVKLSVELNSKKRIWPIDVKNTKLFHKQLYLAKSPIYTQDPIGKIELTNKWKEPINVSLIISTTKSSGQYQSPLITINPNSSKEMDLYIDLNNENKQNLVSHEQLIISADIENESQIIVNESIDIFGHNIWNGNINDLEWYVSQSNADLNNYSISLFDESRQKHKQVTDKVVRKYNVLIDFLESVGKDLKYILDPILPIKKDFVQYPHETFYKKSGDCEDLVVYVISVLRHNNIHSAIVDINHNLSNSNSKLTTDKIGHVFLLVDTGINSSELQSLNLSEFQGISRKDKNGNKTIWIPLEVTDLENGFNEAFKKGVDHYYKEIINRGDINYEKTHVFDF